MTLVPLTLKVRVAFLILFLLPSLADAALTLESRGRTLLILVLLLGFLEIGKLATLKIPRAVIIIFFSLAIWNFLAAVLTPFPVYTSDLVLTYLGLVVVVVYSIRIRDAYRAIDTTKLHQITNTLAIDATVIVTVSFLSFYYDSKWLGLAYFPFSEPAHFARVYGPLLICTSFLTRSNIVALGILAVVLIFALIFPSLTLLMYFLIGIALHSVVRRKKANKLGLALGAIILVSLFAYMLEADSGAYFLDRINVSKESTNLSSLVFLQGVNAAVETFEATNGIGVGLHQLGNEPPNEVAQIIADIGRASGYTDLELNRKDGGFVAAKIISELGIFGLCILLLLTLRSWRMCRGLSNDYAARDTKRLIAKVSMICLLVEIFFRGAGYFSAPILIVLAMFFWLLSARGPQRTI